MSDAAPVVFVVDDDPSVRRATKRLIESVGLQVELFGSTQEFLQVRRLDAPSCLVLDIRLRGKSGRETAITGLAESQRCARHSHGSGDVASRSGGSHSGDR